MANDKKSFMLYYDYREQLALLNDEERGRLLMALFDYGETGTVPELDGATRMAFSFIRAQMDRDADKWEQTRQARARAGQQGGLKSGQSRRAAADPRKQDEADEANAPGASSDEAEESPGSVTVTGTVTETGTGEETDPPVPPKGASSAPIPYEKIMQLYNTICTSLPKIKIIDGQRRKAVAARWRTYQSIEPFVDLFRKAEASTFMRGDNDKGWTADFDWIIRPTNMAKVLEGKYDNGRMRGGASHGSDRRDTEPAEPGGFKLEGFKRADT